MSNQLRKNKHNKLANRALAENPLDIPHRLFSTLFVSLVNCLLLTISSIILFSDYLSTTVSNKVFFFNIYIYKYYILVRNDFFFFEVNILVSN